MNASSLPPLAPGAVPEWIRAEGPDAVDGFRAALSFERVLLDKLLSEALPEEEGAAPRAATLPETLADSIVSAGGAGIATSVYGQGPSAGTATTR